MKCLRPLPVISFVFLLIGAALYLNSGCSHKDKIVSDEAIDGGPEITLDINKAGEQPGLATPIEATLRITGIHARVNRVIYSIDSRADTLLFTPGVAEVSQSISIPRNVEQSPESIVTLTVWAIDEAGLRSRFEHDFYPVDTQAPTISLSHDTVFSYPPGYTFTFDISASDNTSLYYIAVSASGAFAWTDTLKFGKPFPLSIDTTLSLVIPDTALFGLDFWLTVEAVDVNFNSAMATSTGNISIYDIAGPVTEVHPVDGDFWAQQGDSLRFWIVGRDNSPLSCLGYRLEYGNDGSWYPIQIRDSICGDFAAVDSIYVAFWVPDTAFCDNFLIIREFGYDIHENFTANTSYETANTFTVENRLRFSQAAKFESSTPNSWSLMSVDDRRQRVYILNSFNNRIEIYSQSSHEFLTPVNLPARPSWICLSPDTNAILVPFDDARSFSFYDLSVSPPQLDTTVAIPGTPYIAATLSDGTALILALLDNGFSSMLRMDLSDYSLDTLNLGVDNFTFITTSGNSEFALISSQTGSPSAQLFLYQAGVGVIATQSIDWNVLRASGNWDGSRFLLCSSDMTHHGIFDNNLNFVDTIHSPSCTQFIDAGILSPDGADLYLASFHSILIADGATADLEGTYYTSWLDTEWIFIVSMAVNANDDRLFITGQKDNITDFEFWDIPIEPDI